MNEDLLTYRKTGDSASLHPRIHASKRSRRSCVFLFFNFLILSAALLLATACDRRDLEVMEPQKTHLRIEVKWANVDWMEYYGSEPSGMTVMLFGDKHPNHPIVEMTNEVRYVELDVAPDHYRMVLFNNSMGEFGSMNFEQMNTYEQMATRATQFQPMQATEWTKGNTYHRDPEKIGTVLEEFDVTEDMLLSQVTFYPYKAWLRALRSTTRFYQADDLTYVLEVYPKPITSTLHLRVHVDGLTNMRSVEGSISGLADGFMLTREHSTQEEAIHLLDSWKARIDGNFTGGGWLTANIPVWGEPHGLEDWVKRPKEQHELKLHFSLRDGKTTVDYSQLVGKDIRYMEKDENGVWHYVNYVTRDLVLTIWDEDEGKEPGKPDYPGDDTGKDDHHGDDDDPGGQDSREPSLPNVDSDGQGSGFDAEVAEWEDGGTIGIDL